MVTARRALLLYCICCRFGIQTWHTINLTDYCMAIPLVVVALWEISPVMRAPAFRSLQRSLRNYFSDIQ
jgi:hypothetical protein